MSLRARDAVATCSPRGWHDAARTAEAAHCSAVVSQPACRQAPEADRIAYYFPVQRRGETKTDRTLLA